MFKIYYVTYTCYSRNILPNCKSIFSSLNKKSSEWFENFSFPNYKYLLFIIDFDTNISLYSLYIFHEKITNIEKLT
jgi:hypothetical protein